MTQTPHDTAGPGDTGEPGPRVSRDQMRDVGRLRRSTTDRRIAGVAGGLGRHLDIDPTVIRVLLVVLVFFGGAGLLLYGAGWLFVPEDGTDQPPIRVSGDTRTAVLVVALVLAALLLLGDAWWLGFGGGWPPPVLPLLVVGLVAWLVLRNRDQPTGGSPTPAPTADAGHGQVDYARPGYAGPPPPPPGAPPYPPPYQPPPSPAPPRSRSLFGITMALALLALGAVAVVEAVGIALPWAVYPATALAVIGLALVTSAFVGRGTGLGFTGALVALLLAIAVWTPALRLGDVDARPTSAAQLEDEYSYAAGRVHIDLRGVEDLEALDGRLLDVNMGAGEVIVDLPSGLDVDVVTEAEGGQLDVLGTLVEGRDITNVQATPDTPAPDLRINLDLGFGHARVSTP